MNLSAVFHQVVNPWNVLLPGGVVEIKLRTGLEVQSVDLIYGDPHLGEFLNPGWRWKSFVVPMRKSGDGSRHRYWTIRITPPNRRLKYQFSLSDGNDTVIYGENRFTQSSDSSDLWNYFFQPYLHERQSYHAPEWVQSTVWYQIFPERYHANPPVKKWPRGPVNNSTHYGGNLKGITAKLSYLAGLGITGLYLTPIFESPTAHKYDTTDYFRIDPHFGTEDDLRELVSQAHALGIRVMLDAVFNHSGATFAPWLAAQDRNSPTRSWFHFTDKGYETFSFARNMPKLNTGHPEVIEYFCQVATYWIKTCDIDGWRLDVSNEVAPEFWRAFRQAVKGAKPEVYILGEIWHQANPWLNGDMMDGVMNYPFTSLVSDYLIHGNLSKTDFIAAMNESFNRYPLAVLLNQFNLFDSHDTPRILTQAKGNLPKVKQELAFLFFAFGSPCIYYGTEIGMEGGMDPDCRRLMQFDPDPQTHELYGFIKTWIALRKRLGAFRDLSEWVWIEHPEFLVVRRNGFTLILNPSDKPLPLPIFEGSLLFPETASKVLEPYGIACYGN